MVAKLTARELEVVRLRARGLSNDEVGLQLGIARVTVRQHLTHAYAKAHVSLFVDLLAALGWLIVPGEASPAEIRHERLTWTGPG